MLPINPMDPSVTAVKNGDSTPEEAAKQMEAMFVHMILKEIRKTMPDNVFGGGQAGDMYQDMLDSEMAKEIAASGNLGLADQLKELIPAAGAKNDKPRRLQGRDMQPLQQYINKASRTEKPTEAGTPPSISHLPVSGTVTSRFGNRTDPFHGSHQHHDGIDFAAPEGTPIQAAQSGKVTFAGKRGSYGNLIVIDHGNGVQTRYAHCKDLGVKVGQKLSAGENIGTVGSTGRSTGPHLHFEVREGGRKLDPETFFNWKTEKTAKVYPK